MSLKYRNKETGQVVAWSEIHSLNLPFHFSFFVFQYEEESQRNTLSGRVLSNTARILSEEDFLRIHEPVTPPCLICERKEEQIKAHAFSKRRILQVLQEHERQAVIGSSRSLSFSEIAQKTGIEEKFVICMCAEMDEAGQVSIRDLDRCFVMRMERDCPKVFKPDTLIAGY